MAALAIPIGRAFGGTVTVSSSVAGTTPNVLGYNLAHFYTGGNTPAWFRYSGVTGARIFMSPSALGESFGSDDISPWGDGVTSQTSFTNRKSLLRTSQLTVGTTGTGPYINWTGSTKGFNYLYTQNIGLGAGTTSNQIVPVEALSQLRSMNIDVLVNITVSPNSFPINDTVSTQDWAGRWELWQHCYAQAFYLAKNYDIVRYQMYNEPDNASNGLPGNVNFTAYSDFMIRLNLASDAIQSAIADVNTKYGKSLVPNILAPVTTHGDSDYSTAAPFFGNTDWGQTVFSSRHTNFLGVTATNYWLVNQYDFHIYSSTPSSYDSTINNLNADMAIDISADMSGEQPLPVSVSEFNTHTGLQFDGLTTTLDSPAEYSNLGSIGVHLLNAAPGELYCFKFGQTLRNVGSSESDPTNTVAKNGMHYVDNWHSPYNTGGITKAGEVWRLINKGFAPNRNLYSTTTSSLSSVNVEASYDPVLRRYYLLCVNTGSSSASMTVNTSAWNLPLGNQFMLQEVSETCPGAPLTLGTVGTSGTAQVLLDGTNSTFVQPSNSVWLFTLPNAIQTTGTTVAVSEDAYVADGNNKNIRYGTAFTLAVQNVTTNTPSGRKASFLKFHLPAGIGINNIQLAELSVNASLLTGTNYTATDADAHVYGLPNTSGTWSEGAITWSNAPNLADNGLGGPSIKYNFVQGGNASLTSGSAVMICGQLLVTSTSQTEYMVDVTDFLRAQTVNDHDANFLIAREVRYYGDPVDTDGISIVSKEGGTANNTLPRLKLILKNNAILSALTSNVGALTPAFDSNVTNYSAIVPYSVTSATVTPTLFDPTYTLQVRINGGTYSPLASGSTSAALTLNAGANPIDIKVTALDGVTTTTYTLTVTRDTPPTITSVANQTIMQNTTTGAIAFTVGDGETAPGSLAVSGSSSNTTLVPNASIVFSGTGANRSVTITPAANQNGTVIITLFVSDGTMVTSETFLLTVNPTQQVVVLASATVDSSTPNTDVDEAALGYVSAKYSTGTLKKAYFKFDVSSLYVVASGTATLTLNFTSNFKQNVQLWALNQAFPAFTSGILTWNSAQANDLASSDMLTTGSFTATKIVSPVLIPTSGTNPYTFSIPNIGSYVQGGSVTLVLAGVDGLSNNTGGLRIDRFNDTLVVPYGDSPMTTWKKAQFGANWNNSAIAGDAADPDHDGIPNLMEYALNLDPNQFSGSGLPKLGKTADNAYLTLTFRRPTSVTDVTYHVQAKGSLAAASWTEVNIASNTVATGIDPDGTPTVTVRDAVPIAGNQQRFMRLQVTNP